MTRLDTPLRPDLAAIFLYAGRRKPLPKKPCEAPCCGALAELAELRRPQ